MTSMLTVVLLGALLAAPESGERPPEAEFKIWAVEVHDEGREEPYFDAGLDEVRETVKDARFDTYINLKTDKHTFKDGQPVNTALTDRYTLRAGPPSKSPDGRYRMKLRLTMKAETEKARRTPGLPVDTLVPQSSPRKSAREIEALSSELLLQPEKQVIIRGLKLDDGKELILVVSLSVPDNGDSKK